MNKTIFLDRDGVINNTILKDGKPHSPNLVSEFKILPGVVEAINEIKKLEFLCLVITNQPNVSRGLISKKEIDTMNNIILEKTKVDDFFICYHDDNDNCNCRKPKPGLIIEANKKWKIDFKKSFFIGDRWRDVEAGNLLGIRTIFVDNNYDEKKPSSPTFKSDSLLNAVKIIKENL